MHSMEINGEFVKKRRKKRNYLFTAKQCVDSRLKEIAAERNNTFLNYYQFGALNIGRAAVGRSFEMCVCVCTTGVW